MAGRILCRRWPFDKRSRRAFIGSSADSWRRAIFSVAPPRAFEVRWDNVEEDPRPEELFMRNPRWWGLTVLVLLLVMLGSATASPAEDLSLGQKVDKLFAKWDSLDQAGWP
jgi:hypothetical protein